MEGGGGSDWDQTQPKARPASQRKQPAVRSEAKPGMPRYPEGVQVNSRAIGIPVTLMNKLCRSEKMSEAATSCQGRL